MFMDWCSIKYIWYNYRKCRDLGENTKPKTKNKTWFCRRNVMAQSYVEITKAKVIYTFLYKTLITTNLFFSIIQHKLKYDKINKRF